MYQRSEGQRKCTLSSLTSPGCAGYMCLSFSFHCRRLKTHWGWCSTNWGRRRGIWWRVPVRQPIMHSESKSNNSHIISTPFMISHTCHKMCFLQWKMRTPTWTFLRTKVQTATWKSVDLLSRGPHETASWQVHRRGIAASHLMINYVIIIILSHKLSVASVCATGRGARFIGNMQGGDSDEVSAVIATSIQDSSYFFFLS